MSNDKNKPVPQNPSRQERFNDHQIPTYRNPPPPPPPPSKPSLENKK